MYRETRSADSDGRRQQDPERYRRRARTFVLDDEQTHNLRRMHALWALSWAAGGWSRSSTWQLLEHADAGFRAWGVRAAGNMHRVDAAVRDKVVAGPHDSGPAGRLQVAIAARKIEGVAPFPVWLEILSRHGDDPLIPHIVWQNLHPMLEGQGGAFAALISRSDRLEAVARARARCCRG